MSERRAKCDGNHGGPRCADPSCWNDDAPDRLSPETLVALREKAEKATPGPWRMAGTADRPHPVVSSFDRERGYQLHSMAHVQKSEPDVWPHMKAQYCADAAYIAAASPDVVLALVAEVLAHRELFAAVDEWIDARDRLASLPCRPGSMGYTFAANQVERGVARINAAYAAMPLPTARAGADRPGVQRATAVAPAPPREEPR